MFVEYDTPHTFFRMLTLTFQPIVENAVKDGGGSVVTVVIPDRAG